ncbi:RNA polymerase sigma factor [Aliifodinibius sp. S!AR15-10]|uniref:RNA polymerase sigma factor n=1 Tax=Aliifodinibius sp. S!AR15-10 TaxID=2950437 RepID=UPI00285D46AD|nr:RNA polymerase sigma factor [Aliifodinibius sp. S!AR15-10]MDR8391168.1 RNA polymerase sigma factor [Aliifodinibius sp. S!AR15-10]
MDNPSEPGNSDIRRFLLVVRCQAGDQKAFEQLYELFGDKTLRYLKGLLEGETARDIQQEVWLTVYRQISELMNPRGFRTWLYRITHRQAIDQLRTSRRRLTLKENIAAKKDERTSTFDIDELFKAEDEEDLKSTLDQLPAPHREVIVLKYWEGMSYEEIGLIIGCPVGTVRSRLYYAKQKIEEILHHET